MNNASITHIFKSTKHQTTISLNNAIPIIKNQGGSSLSIKENVKFNERKINCHTESENRKYIPLSVKATLDLWIYVNRGKYHSITSRSISL